MSCSVGCKTEPKNVTPVREIQPSPTDQETFKSWLGWQFEDTRQLQCSQKQSKSQNRSLLTNEISCFDINECQLQSKNRPVRGEKTGHYV
jgi:hypothetical protein